MAASSDKLDDLNAIDEAWAELGRDIGEGIERPPKLPVVNKVEADPEIDALIANLDLLGEEGEGEAAAAVPAPAAPEKPTPSPKPPSRSLMPPYEPPAFPPVPPDTRPSSRPGLPTPPERPLRPPSRPVTPTAAAGGSPRTLLAFGAPPVGKGKSSTAETPPAFPPPVTPTTARETVPTPVVTVLDPETGEVSSPALTLDLAEMDNPIRKPSAPRVPIDLSDFEASFEAAAGEPPPLRMPELPLPAGPPAVAESRRGAPTPDEVITTPMSLEDAIGFERELDLPTAPGVAREFDLGQDDDLDALGAVERAGEESVVTRMEREMGERFDAGDFTAALESAEWILKDVPDHARARRYAASCREVLLQMYAARLGSLDRVPSIVVGAAELKNLGLDHRAGFVLSCIDGHTTFAEILDLSGMPPLESYRILCDLILAHVIAVR